jgi:hypothetical protein
MNIGTRLLCAVLVTFFLTASGCTSLRQVNVSGTEARERVEVGDTVRVHTSYARKFEFRVTAVDDEALVGKDVRVPFEDIDRLEVRELDGWKTAGAVGTTVGGLWLIGVLLAAALVVPMG